MHKMLRLSVLALSVSAAANAQKKNFTIAEATNGMGTTLAPKGLRQTSWQPETHNLFFVANNAWVRTNADNGKVDTFLRLKTLNQTIYGRDSLKAFPMLSWQGKDRFYLQSGNEVIFLDAGMESLTKKTLQQDAENVFVAPETGNIAYTVGNNLWFNNTPVTDDKEPNIINGKSVHREEFGIDHGIFFSPKGNLLAYYRMDQTMVADYPVIDWSQTPAVNHNIKYPMAGNTSHQVSVWVYNPETKTKVRIKTGDPLDKYLTCVSWSPDERYIFIATLNREQDHLRLSMFDAISGDKVSTLFEESDSKYVQPQHSLQFLPGSNTEFVWWSQRDGFMHLYLFNTKGKLLRQLTKGNWVVNELLAFNKAEKEIVFTASKESPMEKNTYAVNWETGAMRRVDREKGYHNVTASGDGHYVLDVYSNATTPRVSQLLHTNGKWSKELLRADNTLAAYRRPEVQDVTLKAADGTPLYGKLILPVSFDAKKKYPVIVYLYNGPNVQLLHNSFPASGNLWYEYMAQKGYVVFTMDGRGSSNRGLKFEQATFGKLGTVELEDQLQGVNYLKSLPFVDADRMGIHGWSFGGFMTTSMMLRNPDVFKVGVAGGPVMDWKMYEVMYTERYMNTPQENAKGYEDANLLTKTKNLKGKLLLIHGTDDDVVVWQHSVNFIRKCVDNGVPVDYFVYPGHPHNVRGKDRVHLMQKISDYFDLYLKP
ncbi:S9 family peptidase [Rurimicrobium arvi]|uniref:S9 family peptidase n=1 Tax=Rurimicrobium arvi TaxID=2049916 RepID=A0ABP8MEC7_9BACT